MYRSRLPELVERGAEVHGPPVREGYGMYDFRVSDPDGYVLAFGRQVEAAALVVAATL